MGLRVLSLPVSHVLVHVSRACRDGAGPRWLWAPLWDSRDIAQQQLSGGVLGPAGCSLAGVKWGGWEVSLPHFLWQSHALGSAVLHSSRGGRACEPLASGSHVIARKKAEVEEAACPLPLSSTTCLPIFSLSPNWQIQIYQRGVGFIPSCAAGWQGDLGHVPLSAMTQFPSCKMGSKCDL